MKIDDPGKRDQRVIVRSVPTTKSTTGADIPGTPVAIATVYAKITGDKGGREEAYLGEKLATRTPYLVEIPYIPNLTEDMEILWEVRGIVLDIIQILDLGARGMTMQIRCQEQR